MKKNMKILMCVLCGFTTAVSGQNITDVSPGAADAGDTVTVTLSIDPSAVPPVPPSYVLPSKIIIGTLSGSAVSRSGYTVSASFIIPAGESSGAKDCTVVFDPPGISYTLSGGFTVTGGSPPAPAVVITNTQPMAGLYPVVDTAQTDFYNAATAISSPSNGAAFFGQDATYAGRQPEYTVSTDGLTVYDNVTGLTWTQSHDWDGDGTLDAADKMTQADAAAYAAALNAAHYGGYNDWRLPTIKEIYSLMNFNGTDPDVAATDSSDLRPFIDDSVFTIGYGDTAAGERIIDSQFAVSTIYVDTVMNGEEAMFGLNLVDGRIKGYPTRTGKTYYALYCRGNTAYGINDFSDNEDGTVSDAATGLMWAQDDSLVGMDWASALVYAESSALAGYTDWRLPNAKELQSLVDYTRSPGGAENEAAIDPLFSATPVTNMAGQADFPWYWSGTTHLKYTGSAASGVYVCFGRGTGSMDGGVTVIDVHGAGCQRSDPKSGNPGDYPAAGNGPQGDVQRVFNHVRLVRDIIPVADTDGDGMPDEDELFVGSDPSDPGSVMILSMKDPGTGAAEFSWPVFRSGLRYQLKYCTNLVEGAWISAGSTVSGSMTHTTARDSVYYQLHIITND